MLEIIDGKIEISIDENSMEKLFEHLEISIPDGYDTKNCEINNIEVKVKVKG